ncbi:hypothetical protein GYH30_024956 [Glycine max]|nr:hypothetical protein GYH30_024956 [Glycine max]
MYKLYGRVHVLLISDFNFMCVSECPRSSRAMLSLRNIFLRNALSNSTSLIFAFL